MSPKRSELEIAFDKSFGILADEISRGAQFDFEKPFFDFIVQDFSTSFPESHSFDAWHIRLICEALEKSMSEGKNLVAVLPRGHLKSTVLGYGLCCWGIGRKLWDSVLYLSYKREMGDYHVGQIKNFIRKSDRFSAAFKDLSPEAEIVARYSYEGHVTRFFTGGMFSFKRGLHCPLVVCLTGDTKVCVPSDQRNWKSLYKPIEDIKFGDLVWTHKGRCRRVVSTYRREVSEALVNLMLGNGESIRITGNHPVYTVEDGWVKAGELTLSHTLCTWMHVSTEEDAAVPCATRISEIKRQHYVGTVYNLEVEEDNSYCGRGIIYHNCDDPLRDPSNPLSFTQIRKTESQFYHEIMNVPTRDGMMVVIGTPMASDDLLNSLINRDDFNSVVLPVFSASYPYGVLWPEVFDREYLERKRGATAASQRAFAAEYMLTPALETEAFFSREDLMTVTRHLENYSLDTHRSFGDCFAGFDVGKHRHPSHIAVFEYMGDRLVQVHQAFLDQMSYVEQARYINRAVDTFNIRRLKYDNTRGELEERGLPKCCEPVNFSQKSKGAMASIFERLVAEKKLELINEERYLSQILCVDNMLNAPETPAGHGDSFFSTALAISACEDMYPSIGGSRGGVTTIGSISDIFPSREKTYNTSNTDFPKIRLPSQVGFRDPESCPSCLMRNSLSYSNQRGICSVEAATLATCLACGYKEERNR